MSLLIRNGRIVTAADDYTADIYVADDTITCIGRSLDLQADRTLDAQGLYVLPGGVDPHTHLDFPFAGTATSDDFETGTIAAAHGGTTTIVDFAVQAAGESLPATLQAWHAHAQDKAVVDYGFHIVVTNLADDVIGQIDEVILRGVTSFKLFMAYPGSVMVDDGTIFRVMERAAAGGGLCCIHAENGDVIEVLVRRAVRAGRTGPGWHARTRPERAEAEATHRAIAIAEIAGAPVYFVHVSCTEALEQIRAARDTGAAVFAETCPHYLFLDESAYDEPGFDAAKYVLTPPLRAAHHQQQLWRGLRSDDLQVVSTDHCPFCLKGQKDLGIDDFSKIPNGGPGIEHRLALLHSGGVVAGHLSLRRMVEVFSTAPARLFGLFPRKGTIAVGSDADLVLFDPRARQTLSAATHHMNVDYSLYEGRQLEGAVRTVIAAGRVIIDGGDFTGKAGDGRFLMRGPSGRM